MGRTGWRIYNIRSAYEPLNASLLVFSSLVAHLYIISIVIIASSSSSTVISGCGSSGSNSSIILVPIHRKQDRLFEY